MKDKIAQLKFNKYDAIMDEQAEIRKLRVYKNKLNNHNFNENGKIVFYFQRECIASTRTMTFFCPNSIVYLQENTNLLPQLLKSHLLRNSSKRIKGL